MRNFIKVKSQTIVCIGVRVPYFILSELNG